MNKYRRKIKPLKKKKGHQGYKVDAHDRIKYVTICNHLVTWFTRYCLTFKLNQGDQEASDHCVCLLNYNDILISRIWMVPSVI